MMLSGYRGLLAALGATTILVACQESLTIPGECPGTCPGGVSQVSDTIIDALPGLDSSFRGFVGRSEGSAVLVSNGLAAGEARAFYVFFPRSDTAVFNGAAATFSIDSIWVDMSIAGRDSTVGGLKLYFHRVPLTVDTTITLSELDAFLTAESLVDSILVPDSVRAGLVRAVLTGEALTRMVTTEDDSGRVAFGVRMSADIPSGVRLSSLASFVPPPSITTFARSDSILADTVRIGTGVERAGFAIDTPIIDDPDLLTLGGFPSSRGIIRFRVPARLLDSVNLVRATLQLTPDTPFLGIPNDRADMGVLPVLNDLGAKSILPSGVFPSTMQLIDGASGVVEIDVLGLVSAWQGVGGIPQAVFLSVAPESATFYQPQFRTTRSATGAPRLRLTYVVPSQPERP